MYRVLALSALLLLMGCSSSGSYASLPEVETTSTTSTTGAGSLRVPVQLQDLEIREVVVGDRVLTLAIADSPTLRATGLMGVTDIGDLDGMLFVWDADAAGGFWMKDTLIPLDVAFFDENGVFVGLVSMQPCTTDDCPIYTPGDGIDYRYAIEANPGDLDWMDESAAIQVESTK